MIAAHSSLTAVAAASLPADARGPCQGRAVVAGAGGRSLASFDDVWQTINDTYYDPTFGGVDWNASAPNFVRGPRAATSADDVAQLIREMLGRLEAVAFRCS